MTSPPAAASLSAAMGLIEEGSRPPIVDVISTYLYCPSSALYQSRKSLWFTLACLRFVLTSLQENKKRSRATSPLIGRNKGLTTSRSFDMLAYAWHEDVTTVRDAVEGDTHTDRETDRRDRDRESLRAVAAGDFYQLPTNAVLGHDNGSGVCTAGDGEAVRTEGDPVQLASELVRFW